MSAKELHFVLSDLKAGNHVAIPNKKYSISLSFSPPCH